jgi:pimeloyl-ACP methyl ester carboxylesterase
MTGSNAESPFLALYDRAIGSLLNIPINDKWVDTRDGRTHLLTAGDPSAPPVLVFQGGNITTPVTLAWVQALADDYYLLAPDTPGQPGKTTVETQAAYSSWVGDLLDGLDLDSAAMLGISHGAGIVLEAAADIPDRIETASLVVPAGFGTPLSVDLLRIVLPSLAYRLTGQQWLLDRALAPMFTQSISAVDEIVVETVGRALRTGDLRAEFPGPDEPAELASFEAPTLVITAEHDPFFPGERTCEQAERYLSSMTTCLMLTEERHFLSPEGQGHTVERIRPFLAEHGASAR